MQLSHFIQLFIAILMPMMRIAIVIVYCLLFHDVISTIVVPFIVDAISHSNFQ